MASPGNELAPAFSTDRKQQQQHILTPASAKAGCSSTASCTPLQNLWGSKRDTHTGTHTRTYAHTHTQHNHTLTRMRMRTHTYTYMRMHKHTDTRAHTHTRTNTQTHTRALTHTLIHVHAYTRAHTLSRTHAYVCTRCACDGLRQFFSVASNAPTLVLPVLLKLCSTNLHGARESFWCKNCQFQPFVLNFTVCAVYMVKTHHTTV